MKTIGILRQRTRVFQLVACGTALSALYACGGGDGTPPVAPNLPALAAFFTPPAASASEYQKHLAYASANAGTDPFFVNVLRKQWCYTAENTGTPPELADRTVVPPTQLFDDLSAIGFRWVGQYVIRTANKNFLLIDALNNASEAQTYTVPGVQQLGFQPTQIKAVIPTHGHGDHFGGAGYLQQNYKMPVYLGSADAGVGATATPPFTVTPLDSAILTPQALTIDGTTLTMLSTPGHTVGTFSGVIPVTLKGTAYKLAFWGGTGTPTTLTLANQYRDGAERLYNLARDMKVDGTIHTHYFVDGSLQHIDQVRATGMGDGKTNPFLLGNANTLRSLAVLRQCSAAKVAQLDATSVQPAWLVTTTTATAAQSGASVSVRARVADPYGVVPNATLTVTDSVGGGQCAITTSSNGEGTCTFASGAQAAQLTLTLNAFKKADGTLALGNSVTIAASQ